LEFPRDFPVVDPLTKTLFLPFFFPLVWQFINKARERENPFLIGCIKYELDDSLNIREKDVGKQKLAQLLRGFIRVTDMLAHGIGYFYIFIMDTDPLKLQIFQQRLLQSLIAFSKLETGINLDTQFLQFPKNSFSEIINFLNSSFYGLPQEETL
jgi:hypothetical protein